MLWALLAIFALLTGNPDTPAAKPSLKTASMRHQQPTPKLISASAHLAMPSPTEDADAETELLDLANESRQQAGLPPLRMDQSLTEAAREHAERMVKNAQLEHRFAGEPPLLERIAQVSTLRLDRAGENVAYHLSAEQAHTALMLSPHHRDNLLDSGFNVAGMAAIWSGGRLYVVEDFGREVPAYSAAQTAELVTQSIQNARQRVGLPELALTAAPGLDSEVCQLAREDRLSARALRGAENTRGVATYTQARPEILPPGVLRLLAERTDAHQFAVGTCYSRNATYPTGMYWVAIVLY